MVVPLAVRDLIQPRPNSLLDLFLDLSCGGPKCLLAVTVNNFENAAAGRYLSGDGRPQI